MPPHALEVDRREQPSTMIQDALVWYSHGSSRQRIGETKADISQAIYELPTGLKVVPSGISLQGFQNADPDRLQDVMGKLVADADFILIDAPAGISKDGSKLKPPMGFQYYATLTPDDLDAVVAYLRTVPEVSPDLPQGLAGYFMRLAIPQPDLRSMVLVNEAIIPPAKTNAVSVVLDIDLFQLFF